jgi:hypothetical protein
MAMDATPSGSQADHHITSKADFIRTVKADPAEAIRTGKLKQVKQEVPFGGIGKVVAKVAEKVAEKGLAKATAKASEIVGKDVSKPGTLEKLSQNMSESEKRALASKLKEANVKDKPGLNARTPQAQSKAMIVKSKSTGKTSRIELD